MEEKKDEQKNNVIDFGGSFNRFYSCVYATA